MIRRLAVYILLANIYSFTWLVAILSSIVPRRPWKPTGRIMVTGTFHNPGWYLSHVTPLSYCSVKEVILVVDEPQIPLERVRFVCPPRWVSRLLSRAVAKAIWMIIAGLRYRPDLYMGYHIIPGACSAMVAGKLLGRPCCYQMTGGPVEIIGGGYAAIDSIEGTLGRPSKLIETLAINVVKRFELLVVRGNRAKRYLRDQGIETSMAIITGSVNGCSRSLRDDREIHMVSVGRLTPVKRVDQFITIVQAVYREMPWVRATIVGDGPLMGTLKVKVGLLGLSDNIEFLGKTEDVRSILSCSKIFILTSQSEGLSIAMAEAMSLGVVPVVANVGELGDLVVDGVNGHLVEPNNISEYTVKVLSLLQDTGLWSQYSSKAIEAARGRCGVEVISGKWQKHLRDIVSQASGCSLQEILN